MIALVEINKSQIQIINNQIKEEKIKVAAQIKIAKEKSDKEKLEKISI